MPVLVEVKQASDTRARREVVAQMLDYAANGIAYWSIEQIVAAFHQTATLAEREPDELLSAFLGGADQEDYWRQVEANLRSGRIRMLFVADRIPRELARIVEFLNEQMRPAEVLALEVEQYRRRRPADDRAPPARRHRAGPHRQGGDSTGGTHLGGRLARRAAGQGRAAARQGAERAVAWFRDHGFEVGVTDRQDLLCTDPEGGRQAGMAVLPAEEHGAAGNVAPIPVLYAALPRGDGAKGSSCPGSNGFRRRCGAAAA